MRVPMPRSAIALALSLLALAGCGGHDDSSHGAGAAVPGDPAKATRTVEIKSTDDLKFDPATVNVKRGETVSFKVDNPTAVDHEFVVGDAEFQEHHEEEMRAMGDMVMPDEPTAITVPAGQTKTINLTFPRAGTLLYACHEPAHYPAGMKGEIKVT